MLHRGDVAAAASIPVAWNSIDNFVRCYAAGTDLQNLVEIRRRLDGIPVSIRIEPFSLIHHCSGRGPRRGVGMVMAHHTELVDAVPAGIDYVAQLMMKHLESLTDGAVHLHRLGELPAAFRRLRQAWDVFRLHTALEHLPEEILPADLGLAEACARSDVALAQVDAGVDGGLAHFPVLQGLELEAERLVVAHRTRELDPVGVCELPALRIVREFPSDHVPRRLWLWARYSFPSGGSRSGWPGFALGGSG
ncbi:MAG TPA: hypothetical protein VF760_12435 [Xanthobacteraceae bacterium]